MNIGDLVWNKYSGIIRFGTIQQKRIDEDGWAFFKVKWHCDSTYERAMVNREKLCGKDYRLYEYRKDQIKPVSKNILSKVLQQHEITISPSNKLNTMGLCAPSARFDVI